MMDALDGMVVLCDTREQPTTDVCSLITVTTTETANGYETAAETASEVFCSVCDGVTRSEFYEAYKAGIKLSLTIPS